MTVVKKWAFPSRSRCPRCKGIQTKATSTQGDTQYRKCQAPVCQFRYAVKGDPIEMSESSSSSSSSSSIGGEPGAGAKTGGRKGGTSQKSKKGSQAERVTA